MAESTQQQGLARVESRGLARVGRQLLRRLTHTIAAVPLLGQLVAHRLLAPDHRFDETHVVPTEDGVYVALHRYLAQGEVRGNPVILCHGIACNRHFWDLSPDHSFARDLAAQGRDVWVLEMRGHGQSHRVPLRAPWKAMSVRWDFDHYVQHDLPAAISFVRERGRSGKVDWIGHSMGGMVIYAYLATTDGKDVGNVVTIGSPTFIDNRFWGWRMANLFSAPASLIPHFPARLAGLVVSGMALGAHPVFVNPAYNKNNMRARDAARFFHNVIDDVSGGEVRLGTKFIRDRGFRSRDGKVNYAQQLANIRNPMLCIAGSRDFLVMPRDVRAAFERIGSPDKTLHIFGKKHGQQHEYGHADLVLGRHVKTEVMPVILDWLAAH